MDQNNRNGRGDGRPRRGRPGHQQLHQVTGQPQRHSMTEANFTHESVSPVQQNQLQDASIQPSQNATTNVGNLAAGSVTATNVLHQHYNEELRRKRISDQLDQMDDVELENIEGYIHGSSPQQQPQQPGANAIGASSAVDQDDVISFKGHDGGEQDEDSISLHINLEQTPTPAKEPVSDVKMQTESQGKKRPHHQQTDELDEADRKLEDG